MNITIATSIAPHNIDLQKKAISSWMQLGFEVFSVNPRKEIAQIKDHFPDVVFKETDRDASGVTGRPFVFLDDIFEVLHSSGAEVCSIMNSDISLNTDRGFQEFLIKEVQDGLIFGSRIDVESLSSLEGREFIRGFDYFFFSRSVIKEYLKTDFCLGVPWWDYWVPLFLLLKGISVKQLVTPVAYHLEHPIRWQTQYMEDFGARLIGYLMKIDLSRNPDIDFMNRLDFSRKHSDYSLLALFILNFIFRKTEKIFYLSSGVKKTKENNSCEKCYLHELKLEYYKSREKQIVNHLEEKLMELRTSLSWKITAPLRNIYDKIHK
jgi:hypothetical protein